MNFTKFQHSIFSINLDANIFSSIFKHISINISIEVIKLLCYIVSCYIKVPFIEHLFPEFISINYVLYFATRLLNISTFKEYSSELSIHQLSSRKYQTHKVLYTAETFKTHSLLSSFFLLSIRTRKKPVAIFHAVGTRSRSLL